MLRFAVGRLLRHRGDAQVVGPSGRLVPSYAVDARRRMRAVWATVLGCSVGAVGLAASAQDQPSGLPTSTERIRVELQRLLPPLTSVNPEMPGPQPRQLGIFTVMPPDTNGEIAQVRVPIGDLVTRAAHVVGGARRRYAKPQARREVMRAMRELEDRPRAPAPGRSR